VAGPLGVEDDEEEQPGDPAMNELEILRQQLATLLRGGESHREYAEALPALPPELAGVKIPGSPHTPWQVLEHLRLAQQDILEFCRNPMYVSPEFPEGYWPPEETPSDPAAWGKSCSSFLQQLEAMLDLVLDPERDLFAPIPHREGQTLLREAIVLADHNAYHLGQLFLLAKTA
jgi:hypothetical protein